MSCSCTADGAVTLHLRQVQLLSSAGRGLRSVLGRQSPRRQDPEGDFGGWIIKTLNYPGVYSREVI